MEEKEQRKFEIFETFDGVVGAFLGTWGDNGLLLYRSGSGWEYHESGTKTWDGFHQILYRNHRAEILTLAELEERRIPAPPLDKYPDGTPGKAWADQFSAELPFSKVPKKVLEKLKESSELYLVLQEDEYETIFGDGRYLYPVVAFWDENAAKKFIEKKQKEKKTDKKTSEIQLSYKYALKTIRVVADQSQKKLLADLNIELYEHYSLKDVLRLLKYADQWLKFRAKKKGKKIKGKINVRNIGNEDGDKFKVRFYVSDDGITLGEEVGKPKISKKGLKAGKSRKVRFKYKSKESLSGKYIIGVVEADEQVDESNENNNVIASAVIP